MIKYSKFCHHQCFSIYIHVSAYFKILGYIYIYIYIERERETDRQRIVIQLKKIASSLNQRIYSYLPNPSARAGYDTKVNF